MHQVSGNNLVKKCKTQTFLGRKSWLVEEAWDKKEDKKIHNKKIYMYSSEILISLYVQLYITLINSLNKTPINKELSVIFYSS